MSSTIRRGSSISTKEENLNTNVHFKWDSIKKFLYIAFAFSSSTSLSDLLVQGENSVRIFDYIVMQLTVGMTYLCMDFFIKQYTRKIDFMTYLNPLLRGITFGALLQCALLTLSNAIDLADTLRYLIYSFSRPPNWALCAKKLIEICTPTEDVIAKCAINKTHVSHTSIHAYYKSSFLEIDRATATSRSLLVTVVWITNFFVSTLTDSILVKIMRFSFYWTTLSSFVMLIFLSMYGSSLKYQALIEILNITSPTTFRNALTRVTHTYSIGLIGLHDYSSMSPYTMIDNTVVIFAIVHTLHSFQCALITRILLLIISRCVDLADSLVHIETHYNMFVISPMGMHFLPLENLHTICLFLTQTIRTGSYIAMITMTMARMLHYEFHSIRCVYIVGVLCAIGYIMSLPFTMSIVTFETFSGLLIGLDTSLHFLGCYKVALIMYIYGVKTFSTDIHFWLGFKPTKFWTLNWMLMPIVLLLFFVEKILQVMVMPVGMRNMALAWLGLTLFVVGGMNLKIIIRYLQRNNVMGIFRAHPKYGPLDRDILKKRKIYNETLKHKICNHNCMVYDESYIECDHAEVLEKYDSSLYNFDSSASSITSIQRPEKSSLKKFFSSSMH